MVRSHQAKQASLKADVLIAPHHGGNNGSGTCFTEAVDPTRRSLMSDETVILTVHTDRAGSDSLMGELARTPEAKARVAEKLSLDGNPAGWLVLIGLTIRALPAILDAVGRLIQNQRVKSISLGSVVVENPRPEDVERLIRKHLKAPTPPHGQL
jgi:hypothetical protein